MLRVKYFISRVIIINNTKTVLRLGREIMIEVIFIKFDSYL
jgi:hypothetical protein